MIILRNATSGSISIASFAAIIGAPVVMQVQVLVFAYSMYTGIIKKLLKTTWNKRKRHNKIIMSARSKLNSIWRKISEALTTNEIGHEDFMTIINEEKNYRELKESIRMMKSQGSDTEKINLVGEDKKNRYWWNY